MTSNPIKILVCATVLSLAPVWQAYADKESVPTKFPMPENSKDSSASYDFCAQNPDMCTAPPEMDKAATNATYHAPSSAATVPSSYTASTVQPWMGTPATASSFTLSSAPEVAAVRDASGQSTPTVVNSGATSAATVPADFAGSTAHDPWYPVFPQ